MVVGIEPVI
uniref:Uncharacterized protein n=1 Tax=Arundo donax TaxID=35708 RepID=A0A0A9BP11_ARUDO